jgi:uncharacterized membrane protein (DUF2068 family)
MAHSMHVTHWVAQRPCKCVRKLRVTTNDWPEMSRTKDPRRALQAIAIFEATKGLAVLAGLIGLMDLLHSDVQAAVLALIGRFGLDPDAPYPSMLLHYAALLPDADLAQLVMLASAYITLRFVEATGLWFAQVWAEYLGALSGGIYIPFEVSHFVNEPDWVNAGIVLINLVIVGYLVYALWLRHQPAPHA